MKLFTEHINIMFEKERVYVQSMDSARVSIFEITLPSSWFDVYEHTNETTIAIGINSTMLFRVLNTREKEQEVNFVFTEEESDTLYINFTCENTSIFDKRFELPLIDLDCEFMAIPTTDSQADLSMPSAIFSSIMNQLKMFGDSLDIECTEEKIVLQSTSSESGKMLVDINIDDLTSYAINEGETMKLSFSLNVLHNICMYNRLSKDIEIHLTENFPMKLVYSLGNEDAKISFYLAPKISDDD
jgi:proliferating cell nuclear antigen